MKQLQELYYISGALAIEFNKVFLHQLDKV